MIDSTDHVYNDLDLDSVNPTLEFIRDPLAMRRRAEEARRAGLRIALVPTMGALHEGHCSLIRIARTRSDLVITSVFVNPTQFGIGEDYDRYPRDLEHDGLLAGEAGSDIVFAPSAPDMYPEGFRTAVSVEKITEVLEGAARPGHFRGVTTVVAKLLNITRPHIAVFGQKDAQQVAVVRTMVRDLDFGVEVVVGPIIREADGLALSSRNIYLSPADRAGAPALYRSLQWATERISGGERDPNVLRRTMTDLITSSSPGIVEYISIADDRCLDEREALNSGDRILISLAVRFGTTRLIDNCIVDVPS